jgi:hypothetical protein
MAAVGRKQPDAASRATRAIDREQAIDCVRNFIARVRIDPFGSSKTNF